MNKYRAALLVALRTVLEGARKGKYKYSGCGICAKTMGEIISTPEGSSLYEKMESIGYMLAHVWHKWPHYSGERCYPLPGGEVAYYANSGDDHWRGLNLDYRIDLLEFLISELEKDEAENLPYEREREA